MKNAMLNPRRADQIVPKNPVRCLQALASPLDDVTYEASLAANRATLT